MKPTLQLRFSQHLALTPQLQQSIRLLQLSTLELNQEIDQALADNPLLEREDDPLAASMRISTDGAIINGNNNTESSEPARNDGEPASEEHFAPADIDGDGLTDWGHGGSNADRDDEDGGRNRGQQRISPCMNIRSPRSPSRLPRRVTGSWSSC